MIPSRPIHELDTILPADCDMANSQKQPALHITQKDLIEQLRREVEHLQREVSELQEDKRSLRSDLEHLKKTNLRLELERAELLMALLNRRPAHETSASSLQGQRQDESSQAESHLGWPEPTASVGRLVPVIRDSHGENAYACANDLPEPAAKGPVTSRVRNAHLFRLAHA